MKKYEEEEKEEEDNIFGDEVLPAPLEEALRVQRSMEQNSKRLKILGWVAAAVAIASTGVVVERLEYHHAH